MRHRGSFRVGQDPCTAPKTSLCAPSSGCQCMSTRTLPLRLAAVQHSAGSRVSSRHSSNRAHEALCVCSINARVCRSGIRRHSAASSDRSIALSLSSLERSSSLSISLEIRSPVLRPDIDQLLEARFAVVRHRLAPRTSSGSAAPACQILNPKRWHFSVN